MEKILKVEGMSCMHCVAHVKEALEKLEGVREADVKLEEKRAEVKMDKEVSDEALVKAEVQLRKLKTVRGQIDGLIKMVEEDRYCLDVSNQLMASISILKNINKDVLTAHLRGCVKDSYSKSQEEIDEKIEEINTIINKLSK